MSKHRHGRRRGIRRARSALFAVLATLGLLLSGAVALPAAPAYADDYPTWDEVEAIRGDFAAAKAEAQRLRGLIAALQAEAERTQADSEAKGNAWQEADTLYQAQVAETKALQEQADEADAVAVESERRAGQWAAQLVRTGGGDVTTNLLVNASNADNLLYGLEMSGKISQQSKALFDQAIHARNTAQALTDQAKVARDHLEVLKLDAEAKFLEAQAAAIAAADALAEQRDRQAVLEVQIAALEGQVAATEASYLDGVRARIAEQAELGAGYISDSGWAKPVVGWISSVYGWSASYGSSFHKAVDLAAGGGSPIWAASSGTVSYAAYGWNGGYGNMIMIDHGNGIQTRYAHIQPDGILVSYGQSVGVGMQIAKVGTTGNSTGNHLHFETIVWGETTDPYPFMQNRGITLG